MTLGPATEFCVLAREPAALAPQLPDVRVPAATGMGWLARRDRRRVRRVRATILGWSAVSGLVLGLFGGILLFAVLVVRRRACAGRGAPARWPRHESS